MQGQQLICNTKGNYNFSFSYFNVVVTYVEQLQKSTFKMKELVNVYNPKRWLLEPLNMFKGTVQYRDNLASAYGLGVIFVAIIIYVKYNKKKIVQRVFNKVFER